MTGGVAPAKWENLPDIQQQFTLAPGEVKYLKLDVQFQLDDTTRKLENLTDIERQLSSRKQISGEMPDPAAKDDTPDAGKTDNKAPADTTAKPVTEPEKTEAH